MKLADFVSIAPGTVFRVRRDLHIDYGDCVALVTRGSLATFRERQPHWRDADGERVPPRPEVSAFRLTEQGDPGRVVDGASEWGPHMLLQVGHEFCCGGGDVERVVG